MTSRKTLLISSAVSLVLTSTVALSGVARAATPPPPQSTISFCQNVPDANPFSDVSPSSPHYDNILCLAYAGITSGTTATTYDPSAPVRRDQMASFIGRAIDGFNRLEKPGHEFQDLPLDEDLDDFWDDVPDSNPHKAQIGRLYESGIVNGTGDRTYSPANPVTRAQMASFINRSEKYMTGAAFSTTDDYFTDDEGSAHEDNINAIASVGIASGTSPGSYGPNDPVTRQQMASFLVRWFAVHEAAGDIDILPPDNGPDLLSATGTDVDQNFTFSTGDPIVLTFANPIAVGSTITLVDGFSTTVTLTDANNPPQGQTKASFVLSGDGKTLTITPTAIIAFNGAAQFNGPVTIKDASAITDVDSNIEWNPDKEPLDQVRFEIG